MYTREQLDALKSTLHELSEQARADLDGAIEYGPDEYRYSQGICDGIQVAASHVLALIESQEEVTA